jgi:hypothetical protein
MESLFQGTVLNYGYSLRGQERLKVLESLLSRQLQRPEMIENMHFGFAKVHQRTNRLKPLLRLCGSELLRSLIG